MEGNLRTGREPVGGSGCSPVAAVKVLSTAARLGIDQPWSTLWLGRPTGRATSYRAEHRWRVLLAGLACGLRGVSAGNQWLRTDPAIRRLCGGRCPDQGTVHRWLAMVTPEQVLAVRSHLQQVFRRHGRFRHQLTLPGGIIVDLDAQGIRAEGGRFRQARVGWIDGVFVPGFQRLAAYCASTGEVLDEALISGAGSLMTGFPQLLASLNAIFSPEERSRVLLRGDAHAGTIAAISRTQQAGYRYLFKLAHRRTITRLRDAVADQPAQEVPTPAGPVRCWDVPHWTLTNKDGPERTVVTRVVLFQDPGERDEPGRWWGVAVSAGGNAVDYWQLYRDRGGAIEEYFDQSLRSYHLETKRTSGLAGLEAVHLLAALCWNLLRWTLEDLQLPPAAAPGRAGSGAPGSAPHRSI
jgi:hypothetical protein